MTWLTLLLLGVGVADLVAAARPALRVWPAAAGGLLVVALAGLAGFATPPDWVAVAFIVGAITLWRALAPAGEVTAVRARRTLAALALPGIVLVACSGFASGIGGPLAAWLGWMDLPALAGFTPERILLLGALAVANTATANVVVRLVLVSVHAQPPRLRRSPDAAGAPPAAAPASERLRGGRLLGPMERLLILGFGAAGYLAAAGLAVAAKGLLRFPELQAAARTSESSVDEVTEYFLVGTFASLLVALASVVLLA